MKNHLYEAITAGLIAVALVLSSPSALAEKETTLNSEFQRVVESFMGGEMIVSCGYGSIIFKIRSGIFSEPVLYWKKGMKWKELEDARFKDTGVVFRGLGKKGGVPMKDLHLDVDIPVYNGKKSAKDYFKKSQGAFVPYEYTLDMLGGRVLGGGTLESVNILPITDRLQLDTEKYLNEQSRVSYGYGVTDDEKERRKEIRTDAIEAVIAKYAQEIEIDTAARAVETTDRCFLKE